ncbi:hypothetical protein ACN42_g5089 [Penicillium freii]|uniref:Uncharacterized protein n=1 Tax=Penicillium freii TaxID=48697 RepID=A0A101MK92_PENFR|nr:hypothetical protein ACN42_g5089 [Penicillium freii]
MPERMLPCHVTYYIYRSLDYLSIMLRYSGLFGLVWNSPVQGQVLTFQLVVWLRVLASVEKRVHNHTQLIRLQLVN